MPSGILKTIYGLGLQQDLVSETARYCSPKATWKHTVYSSFLKWIQLLFLWSSFLLFCFSLPFLILPSFPEVVSFLLSLFPTRPIISVRIAQPIAPQQLQFNRFSSEWSLMGQIIMRPIAVVLIPCEFLTLHKPALDSILDGSEQSHS